ncbi:MAG: thioredoxin-disulfide reductase [Actinobacteria bacterium]|jgi:thioredoxin reductase (NADPH)|nr:thioredoxin-disulfide reductase [Actinomycetota bacterium]
MSEEHTVIIIGSGPAGLTAAIYTARANLHPLLIEGEPSSTSDQPGGQLMLTTEIENYPGFVNGIGGPELMEAFHDQAARFGTTYVTRRATKVNLQSWPFEVWVNDETNPPDYTAKVLIIATGARALMLGLENEARLIGHGVSTCATCDGFFFRDQDIAVVGGGDSALEEAIFLTKFAKQVTIIHRRDELRASRIMQDRAFANPKIKFQWNSVVVDVLGDTKVSGLLIKNVKTEELTKLDVTGLFVAIGHAPNSSLFEGQLELTQTGYIKTFTGTSTSVPGVFACGDVQDADYRQAITAAGSGCMAAIDAERWLSAREHHASNP